MDAHLGMVDQGSGMNLTSGNLMEIERPCSTVLGLFDMQCMGDTC